MAQAPGGRQHILLVVLLARRNKYERIKSFRQVHDEYVLVSKLKATDERVYTEEYTDSPETDDLGG